MSSEYILFKRQELNIIEKSFLLTQISTLNSLKNLKQYKQAREEEFKAKIKIKTLLGEAQNELQVLEKLLPQTSFQQEREKEEKEEIIEMPEKPVHTDPLEEELERIKKRLSLLQ